MVTIANRLQAVRRAAGLTQAALAALIEVDKSALCRWEQGDTVRAPKRKWIDAYVSICGGGATVADWIERGGKPPTPTLRRAIDRVVRSKRAAA